MPHYASAFKHMRSDAKKRERNQSALSEIKTIKKAFHSALTAKPDTQKNSAAPSKPSDIEALRTQLISKLDTAARKKIIPKGRANRLKSRIGLALHKIRATPAK